MIKSGVVFSSDIIKEVTKNSRFSEDQVRETFNFLVNRIRTLAKDPDVLSVRIPRIGHMYYKIPFLRRSIGKLENAEQTEAVINKLSEKRKRLKYIEDLIGHKNYSRHKSNSLINATRFKGILTREEMETKQNKEWK